MKGYLQTSFSQRSGRLRTPTPNPAPRSGFDGVRYAHLPSRPSRRRDFLCLSACHALWDTRAVLLCGSSLPKAPGRLLFQQVPVGDRDA